MDFIAYVINLYVLIFISITYVINSIAYVINLYVLIFISITYVKNFIAYVMDFIAYAMDFIAYVIKSITCIRCSNTVHVHGCIQTRLSAIRP
jgi:hypothetical protein